MFYPYTIAQGLVCEAGVKRPKNGLSCARSNSPFPFPFNNPGGCVQRPVSFSLLSRRLEEMGAGKNGTSDGDTQKVSPVSLSRAPFFLAPIQAPATQTTSSFLVGYLEVLLIIFQHPNNQKISFLKPDDIYHVFTSFFMISFKIFSSPSFSSKNTCF